MWFQASQPRAVATTSASQSTIVKVEFHKYGQDKEWMYCDSSRDASERECDRGLLWEEKSA